MGNTVRMRPRDADGIGIGDDIAPQLNKAQQQVAAWNDVWNKEEARFGAAAEEMISQSSKISIKVVTLQHAASAAGLGAYQCHFASYYAAAVLASSCSSSPSQRAERYSLYLSHPYQGDSSACRCSAARKGRHDGGRIKPVMAVLRLSLGTDSVWIVC